MDENIDINIEKLPEGIEIPEIARVVGPPLAGAPHHRPGTILYHIDGYPGWNSMAIGWENDEIGGELIWDIDDDRIVFGMPLNPYMMYQPSTKDVFLKVINFPSNDPNYGGESMWVKIMAGNEHGGTGILESQPVFSDLQHGDTILYGNGNDDQKAEFIAVVTEEE